MLSVYHEQGMHAASELCVGFAAAEAPPRSTGTASGVQAVHSTSSQLLKTKTNALQRINSYPEQLLFWGSNTYNTQINSNNGFYLSNLPLWVVEVVFSAARGLLTYTV